ncbi:MAG: Dabb family protein, partial [Myxococcota bacterium]
VDGLASLTVGLDINRGPRAYDVCLITTHEDGDALARYQADAGHEEVKAYIGRVSERAALVDFETA